MVANHPQNFYADLTDDRLRLIAVSLMDVRAKTLAELTSDLDCNYVRESAAFGRSRNMLIQLCQSKTYDWLSMMHAGMDVTFGIGSVPCRFFRDDAQTPEKVGFFRRNAVDDLFADDDSQPVMWRFVIEKSLTEEDEDRVLFAGYNVYQEKIAEWQYRDSAPTLHSVDDLTPMSTLLPKVSIEIRDDDDAATVKDGTSN